MTKTTKLARGLFALVAAIAVTLVVASPASAAKAGSSTLQLKKSTFEGFADIGIDVEATGKAKFTKRACTSRSRAARSTPRPVRPSSSTRAASASR